MSIQNVVSYVQLIAQILLHFLNIELCEPGKKQNMNCFQYKFNFARMRPEVDFISKIKTHKNPLAITP